MRRRCRSSSPRPRNRRRPAGRAPACRCRHGALRARDRRPGPRGRRATRPALAGRAVPYTSHAYGCWIAPRRRRLAGPRSINRLARYLSCMRRPGSTPRVMATVIGSGEAYACLDCRVSRRDDDGESTPWRPPACPEVTGSMPPPGARQRAAAAHLAQIAPTHAQHRREPLDQSNTTTWRAATPARRRSNASSRSASGSRRSMSRSTGSLPSRYHSA